MEQDRATATRLTLSYEQLRERVLAGQPDGWRLGLGVLVGKGMVAWFSAWTAFTAAPITPAPITVVPLATAGTSMPDLPGATLGTRLVTTFTPRSPALVALSGLPGAAGVVAVLAQMALAHAGTGPPDT